MPSEDPIENLAEDVISAMNLASRELWRLAGADPRIREPLPQPHRLLRLLPKASQPAAVLLLLVA